MKNKQTKPEKVSKKKAPKKKVLKVSFGKLAPKKDYRNLQFGHYLTKALPGILPQVHKLNYVLMQLKEKDPKKLFPMDGNDVLGDCTIAALAHGTTMYSGLIASRNIPEEKTVVDIYNTLSGGEDTGLYMLDTLNYMRQNKLFGSDLLAFAEVNVRNLNHVKQAIRLFGGLYLGFQVQENAVEDFDNKRPWKPGRLTMYGHAVFVTGYDKMGVTLLTWGGVQRGTWGWFKQCADEAYALLPAQAKEKGFTPGFNFEALQKDLQAVTA